MVIGFILILYFTFVVCVGNMIVNMTGDMFRLHDFHQGLGIAIFDDRLLRS